jgi:polyphosphate kinase 2 (PPK2 family)
MIDSYRRFRVRPGQKVDLTRFDPADAGPFTNKRPAIERLAAGIKRLSALQERLYVQDRWALLLIFQAMDAAGKDSVIKHVMSGLNPQGTQVFSFKQPSAEELDHDYLAFERYLSRNGTLIRKFFLHVSKDEQRRRFLERLDQPSKNWKFSAADLDKRERWGDYMRAYEHALSKTSTKHAPWFIVPADHKWFTRLTIAELVVEALESLDLTFPKASKARLEELALARKRLEAEP